LKLCFDNANIVDALQADIKIHNFNSHLINNCMICGSNLLRTRNDKDQKLKNLKNIPFYLFNCF